MSNLETAIEKAGITFHAELAPANPHMDGSMPEGSLHFLCKIKNDTKLPVSELKTYYSVGPGVVENWVRKHGPVHIRHKLQYASSYMKPKTVHEQEMLAEVRAYGEKKYRPTAADVLGCLISDFTSIGRTFEDWASDLGYDTDSRKAERTYLLVQSQAVTFRRLAGAHYEKLVKAHEEDENG